MIKRWLLLLGLLLGLGAGILLSEPPTGSLSGQVFLSVDSSFPPTIQAVATGPVVRGVIVSKDGQYTIPRLPSGEYRLRLSASGFQAETIASGIQVKEGQVTSLDPVTLKEIAPALTIYSTSQVFSTAETPQVTLRSLGVEQVDLKLYRFSLIDYLGTSSLLDLADPYSYGFSGSEKITQTIPVYEHRQKMPVGGEDGWASITLDLPRLSPGSYWVTAQAEGTQKRSVQASYWFGLTDLGLIQKQAPDRLLIEAINLSTQQPLAGVNLQLYRGSEPKRPPLKLVTGNDGLAQVSLSQADQDERQWIIYGQTREDLKASPKTPVMESLSSTYFYGSKQGYEFYTYTDRPLYRPGQTLYYRGVIRRLNTQIGYETFPENQLVQVRIFNSKGDLLQENQVLSSRYGTVHGEFQIPEEAPLGSYEINLSLESGESDALFFSVEEYRKPEFEVTVTPARSWIPQGENTEVMVKAEYWFGGPVANAEVRYLIYRSADWGFRYQALPQAAEETYFAKDLGEESQDYGGYGEVLEEGTAYTDSTGSARISLRHVLKEFNWAADGYYYGGADVQQLRIEVQVADVSRRTVTREGRLRVTQGEFALITTANHYAASPGDTVTYHLQTYGYDQAPISTQGSLSLERWIWNQKQNQYRQEKILLKQDFQTQSGEGDVTVTLPPNLPMGDYRVQVETRDPQGRRITDTLFLWISNPGSFWSGSPAQGIKIISDQKIYQVGETAKLVITSPIPDAHLLLSVEGNTLYEAKIQKLTGSVLEVSLPILPSYQPNVFYTVTLLGPKRQMYQAETSVRVSPLPQFLQVSLETDKERYTPGETAQITVKTRNAQGDPISAETSISVVDAALYFLKEDPTPDIQRFFYQRRYNQVSTTTSFPQHYPGGLDKLANQLRQDFRDTAGWFPNVVTDRNGQATVSLRLPDNLTTWRLTARAITLNTEVGSSQKTIQVTKDLLVRLATPRFLTTGDQLNITSVVNNQTQTPQAVTVRLDAPSTIQLLQDSRQAIQVPAQGSARVEWPVKVIGSGETTLRVSAQADQLQDAMQLTLPAYPFGLPDRQYQQGTVEDLGLESIPIQIPNTVIPGSVTWELDLAANPAAALLGGLDYLVSFPYGCTEQTLSRFLPALAVAEMTRTLGVPLQTKTLDHLPKVIRAGLNRLAESQNEDGGWGWWPYDRSNAYLTSYVLLGLDRARQAGYLVDRTLEDAGLTFLETVSRDSSLDPDTQMMAQSVLSLQGRGNITQVKDIDPATLSTLGQAYRILALVRFGSRETAQTALGQILSIIRSNLQKPRWFVPAQTASRFQSRWSYEIAEVAGPLLQAAVALRDPRADWIAKEILRAETENGWLTTKATADAILGLTSFYQQQKLDRPTTYSVEVRHKESGTVLARWQPTDKVLFTHLSFAIEDLGGAQGSQTLVIQKKGQGYLHYTHHFQASLPTQDPIPAKDHGFKINRQYFLLSPRKKADGSLTYQESPLKGSIQAGEMLLARLQIETSQETHYVMIEDPLPSGAEVLSQDPNLLTEDKENPYWWNWFWTHQEIRDDRITFFSTTLDQGIHEFVYLFRPEIPGEFWVPPPVAEEMYSPARTYGQGSSQVVQVTS
jgi:uncharacterized protein YfaS (alpha-2-macroglobulin family)